jgi:hypothetical protein
MKTEPAKDGFLSPDIELKGFQAYKRACTVCCDYDECAQCLPGDVQGELDDLLSSKTGPSQPIGCWFQANISKR